MEGLPLSVCAPDTATGPCVSQPVIDVGLLKSMAIIYFLFGLSDISFY